MCDACDRGIDRDDPVQWQQFLDQQNAWLRDVIRDRGWAVVGVEGDHEAARPNFSYTVGLTGFGHPELITFGLDPVLAQRLLNKLGDEVRSGGLLSIGCDRQLPVWTVHLHLMNVRMLAFPEPASALTWAVDAYAPAAVTALQVVWDDGRGHFPWQRGYQLAPWMQPLPGKAAA